MFGQQDIADGDDRPLPFRTASSTSDLGSGVGRGQGQYGWSGGMGAIGLEHFSLNASFNSSNSLHGNDGDIAHHAILSSNPFGSSLSLPQTSQAYTPALTCQTILPDVQDGTSYFGARQSADDTDGGGRGAASGNQTMWDNRLAPFPTPTPLDNNNTLGTSFHPTPAPAPAPLAPAYAAAPSPFNGLTSMPPPFGASFLSSSAPAALSTGSHHAFSTCSTPVPMTPLALPSEPSYRTMTSTTNLAAEPGTLFNPLPGQMGRSRTASVSMSTAGSMPDSSSRGWGSSSSSNAFQPASRSPFPFDMGSGGAYGPQPPHTAHPAGTGSNPDLRWGPGLYNPQQQVQAQFMATPRAMPQTLMPMQGKRLRGRSKSYAVLPSIRGRPYSGSFQVPPQQSPTRPASSHSTISELPDLITPHVDSSPLEGAIAHDIMYEEDVPFLQNREDHRMPHGLGFDFQLDSAPAAYAGRALRPTASVHDLRQYALAAQPQTKHSQARPRTEDQTQAQIHSQDQARMASQLPSYAAPACPSVAITPAPARRSADLPQTRAPTGNPATPALPLPDVQWMALVNRVLSSSPDPQSSRVPRPDSLQARAYTLTYDKRATSSIPGAAAPASAPITTSAPAFAPVAVTASASAPTPAPRRRGIIRSSSTLKGDASDPTAPIGSFKGQARAAASPYPNPNPLPAGVKRTRFTYELNDGTIVTSPANPGRKQRPTVSLQKPTFKIPEVPMRIKPPPRKRKVGKGSEAATATATPTPAAGMEVDGQSNASHMASVAVSAEDVDMSGQAAEVTPTVAEKGKQGRKGQKQTPSESAPTQPTDDVDMDAEGEELEALRSATNAEPKVKYGQRVLYAKARKAETEKIRRVARQDKIQLLRDALMRTYGDADMTWDRITIFDQALVAVQECQALRKQSEADTSLQKKGRAEIARLTALMEELKRDKEDLGRRVEGGKGAGSAAPFAGININAHPI